MAHLPDDVASLKKELLGLQKFVQEEREARQRNEALAKAEAAALAEEKARLITMNRSLMVEMNSLLVAQKKKPGGIGFAVGTK